MKAISAKAGSDARDGDAFTFEELPLPEPGANDLLVRIIAVGMNPVDTKVRRRMDADAVLGWDACGTVEQTGSDVIGFTEGQTVFYAGDITRPGCNSEYQLVDYRLAASAPAKISPEDAAAMPLTSITAWEALFDRLGCFPEAGGNGGTSILIIGGAGGVGSAAIQLARWSGMRVFATASRPETTQWCKKLGADAVLNHKNDLSAELRAAGAESVETIFCTTQMELHWQAMAECIAPQGRVVLIDDPVEMLDITVFKRKSVAVCWEFMFTRSMFATRDIGEQGNLLSSVARLLDEGALVSTRQKTLRGLTVENIRAMHLEQESGTMIGKQVLVLDSADDHTAKQKESTP